MLHRLPTTQFFTERVFLAFLILIEDTSITQHFNHLTHSPLHHSPRQTVLIEDIEEIRPATLQDRIFMIRELAETIGQFL
jgi:hypothetical protein